MFVHPFTDMSGRLPDLPPTTTWSDFGLYSYIKAGTFVEAAEYGELLFNCTNGAGSLDALRPAGEANLDGKILVDIANPLNYSQGMPPSRFVSNTDSLGEQIQKAFPASRWSSRSIP